MEGFAPLNDVSGALAAEEKKGFAEIIICRKELMKLLWTSESINQDRGNLKVVNASEVITMDDSPTESLEIKTGFLPISVQDLIF